MNRLLFLGNTIFVAVKYIIFINRVEPINSAAKRANIWDALKGK
jgi:hypothetical protein